MEAQGSWVQIVCVLSVCVHVLSVYVQCMCTVPVEARRECQISWSLGYRRLWATWCKCCEPNFSPQQEQQVLLTGESHSKPSNTFWKHVSEKQASFRFCAHIPMHQVSIVSASSPPFFCADNTSCFSPFLSQRFYMEGALKPSGAFGWCRWGDGR